jgi:hypothetical protein
MTHTTEAEVIEKMNYQVHCIYGDVRITHRSEAWHSGVEVHHPDGTVSRIGSGYRSDVKAREQLAIDAWNALNAEKFSYERTWS